jgi:hypothetical protein
MALALSANRKSIIELNNSNKEIKRQRNDHASWLKNFLLLQIHTQIIHFIEL